MPSSFNKRFVAALFALTAFAFVALAGCSQSPIESQEPNSSPKLLKRSPVAAKVLGDSAYIETVVPADFGGAVSLCDVELYFPPRALNNDTLISICIPNLSVFENHFGTDGLVFNQPVRVVMNYRDADLSDVNEATIKMAWFNALNGEWDAIDCILDTAGKTVTAHVYHFSAYALISD
jgi:hypothetical protein